MPPCAFFKGKGCAKLRRAMSIFDRISRIAKSEYNDLKRRLSSDAPTDHAADPKERKGETVEIDEDFASGKGEKGKLDPVDAAERAAYEARNSWPAEQWPRNVRLAYAALELPLGSDKEAVQAQYRELLKRYHPDKHATTPERMATATALSAALAQHRDTVLTHLAAR